MNTATEVAPRARRTDPTTSHQAAARAAYFADSHKDRIAKAMRWLASMNQPATADRIATASGLTVVQIDRRLPEMERADLVEVYGEPIGGFRCWRLL